MINQVTLVGRISTNIQIFEMPTGRKKAFFILAVPRPYKNSEGIYQTDYIKIIMWNAIAKRAKEYCHIGDLVGLKGRIQCDNYEDEEGQTIYSEEIICDHITFLTSKKSKEDKVISESADLETKDDISNLNE